jgi:hypothetical protein
MQCCLNLALARRMVTVKFFRVISRVEWSNGEQHFEDHLCPHPQGCDVAGGGEVLLQLTKLVSLGFEPLLGLLTRCLLP